MSLTHYEVLPVSRVKAEAAFASNNPDAICEALVSVAYHDRDWRWVQEHCLRLARHTDAWVRGTAAICLGHLARIHGTLDLEYVLPVLNDLLKDPEVAGKADDALSDIRTFITQQ